MQKYKILIVDNDEMICRTLSMAIDGWNYTPIEAGDVKTALELYENEQPDMIFLDINLPDGSGIDVLRTIKKQEANAKVVIITATALIENAIAALRAGACDFFVKPIDLDEVRNLIQRSFEAEEIKKNKAEDNSSDVFTFEEIIGKSSKMKNIVSLARKVAKSDVSTILLQGESGTGKELFAKAIHYASSRADKPYCHQLLRNSR